MLIQPEDDSLQSEEISLFHFCEFVEYYTRHSTDPMYTAVVCEKQAEGVRITPQDITRENIRMLIDTMLDAIEHLEKKWLDEQIQREELEQRHYQHLVHVPIKSAKQKQETKRRKHLYQMWTRWIQKRFVRGKHVPQREVVVW
jgi:histidinol phosphatase-like enzyme